MFPRKGTGLEHPDALLRKWRGEFAAPNKRGRYFQMTLHPSHIGWPNRLQMLDELLAELRGYPGLWNPTAAECARQPRLSCGRSR
jgi:peptidoglycan-N-acetylglucosamine deacetylase